jgi:pimeloyl-ACP methyl ester carboxylesterase
MRHGMATLCALALVLVGVGACAQPSKPAIKLLSVLAGDVTLHVRVVGDPAAGGVLIVLHGGPGNSSDYMRSLEALASEQLAVVTYDQRGTGQSSKPSDGYGLASYIADLEAVRQAAGAERVHLLGHSWGGVLALRYAVAHPDRVQSLILMGSGVLTPEAAQQSQAHKAERVAALQQKGILPPEVDSLSDILPAYFSDPAFELPEELQNMYYDPMVEQETWAALEGEDLAAGVGELQLPVLLLYGEDDPFGSAFFESTEQTLTQADFEMVLLQNCGHYWQECPAPFFERVRGFLETATAQ